MVFTDQMLQPRSVVQMPKGLVPPSVNLSTNKEDNAAESPASLPWSPLGIWYLDGCQQFLQTAKAVLSYSCDKSEDDTYETIHRLVSIGAIPGSATEGRGRRNLNIKAVPQLNIDHFDSMTLPKSKAASKCMKMTHELQEQASKIASQVSSRIETWLSLPQGSMVKAHEQGYSSSLRLLDYPPGVAVHPHTDGSAYTIVYNDCSMAIQSLEDNGVWYELPPSKDPSRLLLMLGSHLDQAIPKRLSQIGCDGIPDLEKLRAPVHRLNAIANPRRALTLHVKADTTWPYTLEKLNGSNHKSESGVLLEANDYHERDIAWDAELFSHYLCDKSVPSAKDVLNHLALLASLVEGYDVRTCETGTDSSPNATPCSTKKEAYLLPDVHCTGYWQLQTKRYSAFLRIHKHYPLKAAKMLPPREIHHVWLCHQLHPLRYKADSIQLIGKILDHVNSNFCLDGCPVFHQLWLEETGESWPSRADLRREAIKAKEIPEVAPRQDDSDYISANLWHNYDSLARLYFELQGEAPELFASGLDHKVSFLKEARLEYSRFLIASSYAATVGMTVTPSGLVDLVWHTHQTDPKGYDCTIQREFLTGPIDHVPCGALNPPPDNGKEWLEMTDKIWIDLFGKGVNVQGQAIHCCTPINPRPERAVVQGPELVWWFPASVPQLDKPCIPNFHGFMSLQEAIATVATEDESQVHRHVLAPLLRVLKNVLQAHKEELASIKSSSEYRLNQVCMFVCVLVLLVVLVVPWIALSKFREKQQRMTEGQAGAMMAISLFVAPFAILWAACLLCRTKGSLLGPIRVNFWSQISAQVDSFNERAAEFNISIMFVQCKNGPVDPSHTENDRYQGPALVFTRCLPPNEGRDNTLASVEAGQSLDYENSDQDTLEEEKEDGVIPGLP